MLRRKNGKSYATLPGGGIEEGETPAEACAREVLEEVNLVVEVGPEVLVLDNLQNHEHYFLTRLTKTFNAQFNHITIFEIKWWFKSKTNTLWSTCRNDITRHQAHVLRQVRDYFLYVKNEIICVAVL